MKKVLALIVFMLLLASGVLADSPQPKILLVKDAHSYGHVDESIAQYYTDALNSLGLAYDSCTIPDTGNKGPGYNTTGGCLEPNIMLKNYDIVVWFTGNDGRSLTAETLLESDREALKTFLDNGGKLFLTGQDIGRECYNIWNTSPGCNGSSFYADYLHAYYCKDSSKRNKTTGATSDSLGNLLSPDIGGGAGNQVYPSVVFTYYGPNYLLAPLPSPSIYGNSFYYTTWSANLYSCDAGYVNNSKGYTFIIPAAVRNHTTGPLGRKVVYFAFGFEGITNKTDRVEIMKRIYNYFAGPKVTNTGVYRRNLENTSWEEGNLTCSPSDSYCLRKLPPLINATCKEGQLFANVTGGEYFINDTEPAREQYQTGTQLFASDGTFNSQEERLNNTLVLPSTDGTHKVWIHCNNTDNYYGKFDTAIFTLDRQYPYFTATEPFLIEDNKDFTNRTKPKITVNYPPGLKPDYMAFTCNTTADWKNDISWTEWIPYSSPYYGFDMTNSTVACSIDDGNRTVLARIRDEAGNAYPGTASDWIVLDRVAPRIISISPQNNSYIRSADNITISFYDPPAPDSTFSGVNTSMFFNETHYVQFSNNTPFNPGWSLEGLHTLTVYINDSVGNLNTTTYEFTVDNTPPAIVVDSPQAGRTYSGTISILTSINDPAGVGSAWYKIISATNSTQVFISRNLDENQGWDDVWNSTENITGTENVTLIVYANDTLGNAGNVNINFTVDNTKPTITIVYPRAYFLNKNFYLDIRAVVGNPSTTNLTNASYYIFFNSSWAINNTTIVNAPSFNFTDSIDISSWSDGNYTINATAYDNSSNVDTDLSWFYVDRAPPVAWGYRTDITNDTTFNDLRVYPNTQITFSVNVSENVTQVDKVLVTVSSPSGEQNFSLIPKTQNLKNDTWQFTYTPSSLGYHNFTKIYANDTLGNMFSDSINIPVLVVNGSASVTLDSMGEMDAGRNATLNFTFYFNKTFSNPTVLIYIPPNSPTDSNQTPNYFNVSSYTCNNCLLSYKYDSRSNITVINVTGLGNVTSISLSATVRAGTPSVDTNDVWIFSFRGISYTNSTRIKTPFLNITRIFCDNSTECLVEPNKTFDLTVEINNPQLPTHTGKAYDVYVWFKDSLANSSAVGNMSSGDVTNVTWPTVLNDTGNYTFIFGAWEQTKQYNATSKTFVIRVKDVDPPSISSPSWEEDNIINVNETTAYFVKVSDNVGISQVWATINQSIGNVENKTLILDQHSISYDVWRLAYDNTSWPGNYSILNIYANDTSGNVGNFTPTGNTAWFEVIELSVNSAVAFESLNVNNTQTIYTNITGNASTIESVLANVSKPRGFYEVVPLSLKSISNATYIFEGNYTNVTRSGNYSISINVSLSSSISKSSVANFSAPYGNVSISFDWPILYLTNTTGKYNLTFYMIPDGGDLTDVNGSLQIDNTTVVSLVSDQNQSFGNIYWEERKSYPIRWEINTTNEGSTNVTLWINSTTPSSKQNESKTINVTIIPNDIDEPMISGFGSEFSMLNLFETNKIWVNASDLTTVVNKVFVEITYPSSGKENFTAVRTAPDFYELLFSNTNETGNFSYRIFVTDVANNTNVTESRNFTVVDTYRLEVSTDSTVYNKGMQASISVKVKNVNQIEVKGFNLTLILNKNSTSQNSTLVNKSLAEEAAYWIVGADPPVITGAELTPVPDALYTVFAEVDKNGNKGSSNTTFLVSPYLDVEFLSPPESAVLSPGAPINLSVRLKNKRGETVATETATAVASSQKWVGPTYVSLPFNSETGAYELPELVKVPSVDSFTISAYAVYAGNRNLPGGVLITLKTSLAGPTQTTLPSSGGAPSVCNCTEWTNVACGAGGCKETELYQTRTCTPAGCALESRCIQHPACEERIDFEFTLSETRIPLQQGTSSKVSGSVKNTGSKPITVKTYIEKDCCELRLPESFYIDVNNEVSFSLDVHIPLSTTPGEYSAKVKMEAANMTKEKTVVIVVEKNQLISLMEGYEKGLDILETDIAEYKKSGVDVSELENMLANARKAVETAKEAIPKDDFEALNNAVSEVGRSIDKMNSMLFGLRLQKFLYENKWNITAGVIAVVLFSYILAEIVLPLYRLNKEIKRLEFEKDSLVNSRIETEKQFFLRRIDEKTFRAIIAEKQSQLYRITAGMQLKREERRKLVFVKLNPLSFFRWVARCTKGLWKKKEIVVK